MKNGQINYIYKMKIAQNEFTYIYSVHPSENSLRYKYYILCKDNKRNPTIISLTNGIDFIKKYNKKLVGIKPSTDNQDYLLFINLKEQAEERYYLQNSIDKGKTINKKNSSPHL